MSTFGFFDAKDEALQGFRTLCQNAQCRALLGQLHIPCGGGRIVQVCYRCESVSEFELSPRGIVPRLVGRIPSRARARAAPAFAAAPHVEQAPHAPTVTVRPRRVPGVKPE